VANPAIPAGARASSSVRRTTEQAGSGGMSSQDHSSTWRWRSAATDTTHQSSLITQLQQPHHQSPQHCTYAATHRHIHTPIKYTPRGQRTVLTGYCPSGQNPLFHVSSRTKGAIPARYGRSLLPTIMVLYILGFMCTK